MGALKDRLQADLTAAIKARDDVHRRTLRMALTSIRGEEVAGETARGLSADEELALVGREAKRRKESAEAFDGAGRTELAEAERAELAVLQSYLPAELDDAELATLVDEAIAETGATTPRQMGVVMKAVLGKVAGRADGKRVAAQVKSRLTS